VIDSLMQQAVELHRVGRLEEAKAVYKHVLAINPRHADALHLQGVACLQGGDPLAAAALIREALKLNSKIWGYHANLGQALLELRQGEDALAAFRQAGRLNPGEPQLQMGIATCLASLGRPADAESQLRKVTQRHPGYMLAWFNLGNALRDQGRYEEAIRSYERAIALDPAFIDSHMGLGYAYQQAGRFEEAERIYAAAIAREPGHIPLKLNLASVQIDRGRFAEGEETCRRVLAADPNNAMAHCFIGSALGHQGRVLDAVSHQRKAVALEPDNLQSLIAYGSALTEIGQPTQGLRALERAAMLAPASWQAHAYLSTAQRTLGELDKGWREFAHRANRTKFLQLYPDVTPVTAVPARLDGRHVCIQRQEGLGDQLFFLRFAPVLKAAGARITYRATPKLMCLLERVPMLDRIIADTDPIPPADYVMLAGDLPLVALNMNTCALDREAATRASAPLERFAGSLRRVHGRVFPPVPSALALTPLEHQVAGMRARLAALGPPPYVGITWRGGVPPEEQQGATWMLYKEAPLAALGQALSRSTATWLALQRNPLAGEIDALSAAIGAPVHDVSPLNDDLEAMLALLTVINDYVGVSNTNMHLSAGAGRTARVLMPCPAEWRWLPQGRESPWFPGFTIYRQGLNGDWSSALATLGTDLARDLPARAE
jgi:tetratricopeptide (TPR) repeat protein